jgi:hypothetical protein
MPEYVVHILNWEVDADSPREAAEMVDKMIGAQDSGSLVYTVTNRPVEVVPVGIADDTVADLVSNFEVHQVIDLMEEFPHLRKRYENEPDQI